jgi:cobaltochelatase CobT
VAETPWLDRVFAKLLKWSGLPPDGSTATDLMFREARLRAPSIEPAQPRADGSIYWVFTTDFDEVTYHQQLWPSDDGVAKGAASGEAQHAEANVAITLLIEHSGSVRQHALPLAAAVIRSLIDQLELATPSLEVLGYTTGMWKGGRPRERWKSTGSLPNPGRLNELLHIVYRSHDDAPSRDLAGRVIATLARADICKENIDGEAVSWAAQRLALRHETRKILILVNDGAPQDDATTYYNGKDFLLDHFREVVRNIHEEGHVIYASICINNQPPIVGEHLLVVNDDDEVQEKVAMLLADLLGAA